MATVFLPKGMRDHLPSEMRRRIELIGRIRAVFHRYGFEPLETPAMERIETLLGKLGADGEKLIYKVLRRGEGEERGEVDLALRYDLTVPLARVVAMNPQLVLPFKRSQIQPVWRAERHQKGRFREFYQCDVDIAGSASPIADAECIAVLSDGMQALGFREYTIRLNHRHALTALARAAGAPNETAFIVALDKLDKIGPDGVRAELVAGGFTDAGVDRAFGYLERPRSIPGSEAAYANLDEITSLAVALGVPATCIVHDPKLARGLDYYTGAVWEVEVTSPKVGSLGSGGRYDNLVGSFAGKPIPAVGSSLGLERILVVMEELQMFEKAGQGATAVWVTVFDRASRARALEAARVFRDAGIPTEVHLGDDKLGKQFKAAAAQHVPFALVIGPDEAAQNKVVLKDLNSGEQWTEPLAFAVDRVLEAVERA